MWNGMPFVPRRRCRKNSGPSDSSLVAMAQINRIGKKVNSAKAAKTMSKTRFARQIEAWLDCFRNSLAKARLRRCRQSPAYKDAIQS